MKELFINSSFNFINKHQELDHYNQVKIKYGLEVMYHFFTKLIVITLVSYFLGILKNVLLTYFFFGFLRMFGYGMHARSNVGCWILTTGTYLFIGFISKYISFYNYISLSILFVILFSYLLWAPSETKGKPIKSKKVYYRLKFLTVLVFGIEILIFLKSNTSVKNIILLSNILEMLLINPIIHKLFKYNTK